MKLDKDTVTIKAETLHLQETSHCPQPSSLQFLTHVWGFSDLSDSDFFGLL